MAEFRTELVARKVGRYWTLFSPLVYRSDVARRTFTVPAGYQTDFASVPRLPFLFMLFGDTSHAPAVGHDWLYQNQVVSRSKADAVFREALKADGAGWLRRHAMWLGVRIGGGAAYGGES